MSIPTAPGTSTGTGTGIATLVRISLNVHSPQVRRDLARPDSLHKTVMTLAPAGLGDSHRQEAGLLFRLDQATRHAPPTLLVQSQLPPDLADLSPAYGQTETRDLTPMLAALTAGRRVRYRITANAVVRRKAADNPDRRTDEPLHGDAALLWWHRKAAYAGLALDSAALTPMSRSRHPISKEHGSDGKTAHFRYALTRFDGQATIIEPDLLRHAVLAGIGRAKSHGAGLLSLAPA
ncbi:type I-E CRISPR-associated protein Cas6/Cse3/CasE [Streptomyces sp. NPDC051913]|uniref:type I-E CRISPR-associated protein Cas6/Cse3/CasE n=1 Tax=Streptomyces sp. NPDC051913 TaxID=3365676 RepID=UPI0037D59852